MIDIQPIVTWAAPIASTILTTYVLALINRGEKKRDDARAETEANRAAEAEWRRCIEEKMDEQEKNMKDMTLSLQSTMRTNLVNDAERYFRRGSITPEEHKAWSETYALYSKMGPNGLIDAYHEKIDLLPHVTIDEMVSSNML